MANQGKTFSFSMLTGKLSKYTIFIILLLVIIISSFLSPNFLTKENIINVLRQNSVVTILAFGETMLIITGLLDLSCGAVFCVAGVIAIFVFKAVGSLALAMLVGIIVGVLFNMLNGAIVSVWRVQPFIATLAITQVARGTVLQITKGQSQYQIGKFVVFGQGSLLGIPIPIYFMVLIFLVTWYILNQTRLGRRFYAIGGNAEAANASGIQVQKTKFICFMINGVLVGLAGVIFMSRVNAGIPSAGTGYENDALIAAIIGGTSFTGGVGTAAGTVAGAFIVGILNNIMNLIGVNPYIQQIVKGFIIALAVILDMLSKNRKSKPKAA
jgi:inositol transport system permease protein